MIKINILGTEYTIIDTEVNKNGNGSCDFTTKKIHMCKKLYDEPKHSEWQDMEYYRKKVLKHEIIHAFRFESGFEAYRNTLDDEVNTDWFAMQFNKIYDVFKQLKLI